MAVGIRYYAIFNLILVLFAAQTIFGEVNTHESSNKVRRSPAGSPVNSFQWKKDDNINKLRKDILASIPADYQAVLLKQHSEEEHGDAPQDLAALDQVGRPGHETDARDVLNHFLSRQSARNNKHEAGLESKRNGFFFGKRNGFFFGKRDTEAVNSDLCTSCGPHSAGQCVMFGTCCIPQYGCYIMTPEASQCTQHHMDSSCWRQDTVRSCGIGRRGICAGEDLCFLPKDGAFRVDLTCSTTQQKNINDKD